MKNSTKILLLSLCAVLLVATSIFGTLAYLTDTQTVTNTFTVGNVHIKLDEAKVDDNGQAVTGNSAERVGQNSYHLLPGHTYTKDPTVTVLATSDDCYVRMKVTATFENSIAELAGTNGFAIDEMFTGYDKNSWTRVGEPSIAEDGTAVSYEYRYHDVVVKSDTDTKLDALFDEIEVPQAWDNDDMAKIAGMNITIVAEAIQADGFASADLAWSAFDSQKNQ